MFSARKVWNPFPKYEPGTAPKITDSSVVSDVAGARTRTDNGTFTLRCLAAGSYALYARAGDSPGATLPSVEAGTGNLRLVVHTPGRVKGKVTDARGVPLPHFSVDAQMTNSPGGAFELAIEENGGLAHPCPSMPDYSFFALDSCTWSMTAFILSGSNTVSMPRETRSLIATGVVISWHMTTSSRSTLVPGKGSSTR